MFDIGIIGAGPAGYSAAIRAAQKGLKVILFEKEHIGGTCLNKGCIPTKTILHICNLYSELRNINRYGIYGENFSFKFDKIQERQRTVTEKIRKSLTNLIKSYGIEIIEKEAKIKNETTIITDSEEYEVKNIIIATGSKPNIIKFKGNYENNFILTSDDLLELNEIPKSVLIVGSGAIGIEWARILYNLGVKIYIIEIMKNLIPSSDLDISERIERIFKRNRIEYYTETTIEEIQGNSVKLSTGKIIEVEKVLLGAGRKAEICEYKDLESNRFIDIDSNYKTNKKNVYAIGDVNGKSMLAHSATRQAEEVIENIVSGENSQIDYNLIPKVIYGNPEIASIGKTEQELESINYRKSIFPISALGKAQSEDKIEGFIKILATETEILGAHIISEEASAMIEQIAIAMANKIPPKDLEKVIFAHPSYSEGILETIYGLNNKSLNIRNMPVK